MRRVAVLSLVVGLGCGPAVAEPRTSTGKASDAGGSTGSEEDPAGETIDTGSSTQTTTNGTTSTAGDDASSSGGPLVFEPEDYEGIWVCETGDRTFALFVDDYLGGQDVSGRICVPQEDALDPPQWQLCGDLTLHPIDGTFPIYAIVPTPEGGEPWDLSAFLFPSDGGDGLEGIMVGPAKRDQQPVTCKRWP
ncbi:MAG: hypothetical protein KUG77_25780 [Nannocystaceae bacterium]|nr:hypothetical protein [Nannocystaceae bacterium]